MRPRLTARLRMGEFHSNFAELVLLSLLVNSWLVSAACSECPKHGQKATVGRDWNGTGNRTGRGIQEKWLTRETDGGVSETRQARRRNEGDNPYNGSNNHVILCHSQDVCEDMAGKKDRLNVLRHRKKTRVVCIA